MQKSLLIGIVLALLLEGTITSLPLVMVMLIISATKNHSNDIFFVAFLSGLVLDVLQIRPLGVTSVYFLVILFLFVMYERKYEVASSLFITIATFVASSLYFLIFPVPQSLVQIISSTVLAYIIFATVEFVTKKRVHPVRL